MIGGVFALNQGGSAIASIPIHAVSVATAGANQYVEIAMVLDNTGSMFSLDGRSESRFTILRNEAKNFVNRSFDNTTTCLLYTSRCV